MTAPLPVTALHTSPDVDKATAERWLDAELARLGDLGDWDRTARWHLTCSAPGFAAAVAVWLVRARRAGAEAGREERPLTRGPET